ncbi:MAG: hypothetical protein Q4D58_07880 [Synergistaceae bacterium]|nr:hypothetical protein [Synergistaceae bacterium]
MIELLFELRSFCLDALKDLSISSKSRAVLPAFRCFIGEIPGDGRKPDSSEFPLLILRLLDFDDRANESTSTLTIRIIVGIFNEEESNADKCSPGYHDLLNAIERLRRALLKKRLIGNRWARVNKLQGGPFDIQAYPYWFGDIIIQYDERQTTEEFSIEEEIDTYGSAYGNDETSSWRHPADSPDRTDDERSTF